MTLEIIHLQKRIFCRSILIQKTRKIPLVVRYNRSYVSLPCSIIQGPCLRLLARPQLQFLSLSALFKLRIIIFQIVLLAHIGCRNWVSDYKMINNQQKPNCQLITKGPPSSWDVNFSVGIFITWGLNLRTRQAEDLTWVRWNLCIVRPLKIWEKWETKKWETFCNCQDIAVQKSGKTTHLG